MKHLLLRILILLPLAAGAQDAFDMKSAEAKIKKYLYSRPDSTKVIIDDILAQKNLHDSIRGYMYNVYGIYYSNMAREDSALVCYNKSIALLKEYPRIRARTLMNASIVYRNRGQYDKSFEQLEDALAINKKLGLKANEAVVYSNMASNYQFMLEYDKAVECLLKGIAILEKEKEIALLASLKSKLANTYMRMGNFNFAKELNVECLPIFLAANDNNNHALTLVNLAECERMLNQFASAKNHLRQAIKELKVLKNPHHTAIAYSKIANIARQESDFETADRDYATSLQMLKELNSIHLVIIASEYIEMLNNTSQYRRALPVIEDIKRAPIFASANAEDKSRFNLAAAKAYSETDNSGKALADLEKAIRLKDSLGKADNVTTATKELQAQFQSKIQNEKNKALKSVNLNLEKDREARHTKALIYIIASLALIAVAGLYLRSNRLKARLRREALNFANAEKEGLQKQHDLEKEMTRAQRQLIEEKQRELASSALKMAGYQDTIGQIAEKCDSGELQSVSDAKKELQKVIRQKEYWKQFEARFNTLHPEFSNALMTRYSGLTKNDIEFCALLKLNLSNKEIASILQISHESAITRKYRIKKKLALGDDSEFENLLSAL